MTLPAGLQAIVEDFSALPPDLRVEALVEYASFVPPLPDHLSADTNRFERVEECQTPFRLLAEVEDGRVRLYFECPPDAPMQRAFAGILFRGLDGATVDEVLSVPHDLPNRLGLAEAISTLRLRGFHAIIARLRRQVESGRAATPG